MSYDFDDIDPEELALALDELSGDVWGSDEPYAIPACILMDMAAKALNLLAGYEDADFWRRTTANLKHLAGWASGLGSDELGPEAAAILSAILQSERQTEPKSLPLALAGQTLH